MIAVQSPEAPLLRPVFTPTPSVSNTTFDPVYALVSYLPEPIAAFLDSVRRDLVPSCFLVSHVTVLPPRPITGTPEQAFDQLTRQMKDFGPFEIELGEIQTFDATAVVYLGLHRGQRELIAMHDTFNIDCLGYREPWPFHPHITMAQGFDPILLQEKKRAAMETLAAWSGPRVFSVNELCFVQRTHCQNWASLACSKL